MNLLIIKQRQVSMARQYVQRLSTFSQLSQWSVAKPLLTPSLTLLRPTFNAQRLLTFSAQQNQQHQQQQQQNQSTTTQSIQTGTIFDTTNNTPPSPTLDRLFNDVQLKQMPPNTSTIAETVQNKNINNNLGALEDNKQQMDPKEGATDCFQFIVHAAWHAKNRNPKQRQSEDKLPYWKRSKVGNVDAGEDAFFHTCTPYGMALGVADGVGGWAEAGVDPAIFSWTLMNNAAGVAKKAEQSPPIHALQILDTAFHQLRRGGKVAAGSSTACILNLCKITGEMTSVNLGDSAFVLIRDEKIVYESPSQQHYFNCPYQLTVVPDTYPDRDSFVTDMPKDADQKTFFLKDNDIILLATDGYFDNVYPQETLSIVNSEMKKMDHSSSSTSITDEEVAAAVRLMTKNLTDTARRYSLDPKRLSPWARDARAHGSNYRGGKIDDITCIVTLVRGLQGSSTNTNVTTTATATATD